MQPKFRSPAHFSETSLPDLCSA